MKNTIKLIIVALLISLGTSSLFAGSGHSHNVSKNKILKNAQNRVTDLVATKKLAKSWLEAKLLKMEKQNSFFNEEWKVSFKNIEVKDSAKQILYVYLTTYGQLNGVNYTGK